MSEEKSPLERRYRRLLALYPRDHRERNGEEMLGVLMADAGDRSRLGWRDSADLLWGAVRLHLRRVVAADGGVDPRNVLAIVSLLGPVAILAGATTGLHELAWWVKADSLGDMPWQQFPDAPVWVVWTVVAVLGVAGRRRVAAVGAWVGTAGFALLAIYQPWWTIGWYAGWVLLGALTAVALTWSPGPARARELVGRRWGLAVVVLAVAVAVAVGLGVLAYREQWADWARVAVLVVGAAVACGFRSRVGRRAAFVLLVPVLTGLLADALVYAESAPLSNASSPVMVAVFYGVPVLVLLALGGLPRRVRRTTR